DSKLRNTPYFVPCILSGKFLFNSLYVTFGLSSTYFLITANTNRFFAYLLPLKLYFEVSLLLAFITASKPLLILILSSSEISGSSFRADIAAINNSLCASQKFLSKFL